MKNWQKKEKKDAKDFKARRTPRSGGIWSFSGDLKNDRFLIESKKTEKKGFNITNKIWEKVWAEALKSQRMPLLSIELGNEMEIVVLEKGDFLSLLNGK